jgi:hypothetical protein
MLLLWFDFLNLIPITLLSPHYNFNNFIIVIVIQNFCQLNLNYNLHFFQLSFDYNSIFCQLKFDYNSTYKQTKG